jgi:SEC-C motif
MSDGRGSKRNAACWCGSGHQSRRGHPAKRDGPGSRARGRALEALPRRHWGRGPRLYGLRVQVSPPPGQEMVRVSGVTDVLVEMVKMQLVPSLVS